MHTQETELPRYGDWAPTSFDTRGLSLPDRQDWLVCPVSTNRDDACPVSLSNWAAMREILEAAGEEGEDWEEHSFNHWGPGWFSIYIVKPGTKAASEATDVARALEDYPLLDEMKCGEIELGQQDETFENCYSWDFCRSIENNLGIDVDTYNGDGVRELFEATLAKLEGCWENGSEGPYVTENPDEMGETVTTEDLDRHGVEWSRDED